MKKEEDVIILGLLNGKISKTLIELWWSREGIDLPYPLQKLRHTREGAKRKKMLGSYLFKIGFALLLLTILLGPASGDSDIKMLMGVMMDLAMIICGLYVMYKANKVLERNLILADETICNDCCNLRDLIGEHMGDTRFYEANSSQLHEICTNMMIRRAHKKSIEDKESDRHQRVQSDPEWHKEFGKDYDLLDRFSLAENGGYGEYFRLAEERFSPEIKSGAEENSSPKHRERDTS